MIDRELYLPQGWLADTERCHAAGVPDQVGFATKPELARVMLERALDAGVPAGWVTADEVYGGSPALRGLAGDPPAALCAGGQAHRAAAGAVRAAHASGPAGQACPTGGLAAYQRRPGRQGSPLVWVEPGGAQHGWRAGGVGTLAAAAPQPDHRGAGVLRVRRPGQSAVGRLGPGRRVSLAGGGGGVPGQQGVVRPGQAPGPPLALLVSVGGPGHAGLRLPGGDRGHRTRPPPTTVGTRPVDLQRDPAPVCRPRRRSRS